MTDFVPVGADPEVFVRDLKGRFRSAHGLIEGTKKNPYPVPDGAVQVDGLALEFNINPARTREEFINNIGSVLSTLAGMVPGYELAIQPTARFHWRHMAAQPEEALELGCEPDFNAYTGEENPRPDGATTMRTAAGHVHIGFVPEGQTADVRDPEHFQRCCTLVKHLDAFLGLPSLMWDDDNKRRLMYGKAGCFRPKPYGVEYRTMSNAWLRKPELVGFVFDNVQAAIADLKLGNRFTDGTQKNIRRGIDKAASDGYYLRRFWMPMNCPNVPLPPQVI